MNPYKKPPGAANETALSSGEDHHRTREDVLAAITDGSFLAPPRGGGEIGWFLHYRVLRIIGVGGMGIVMLAEDTHLRRSVALKVMQPQLASNRISRQRFLREARAMAAVHHDRVVTVYQVGLAPRVGSSAQDVPFMAMEYLEGETLQDRLLREPRLPAAQVARIGREIAEGLAAAHAKGLIHRDIKPANVWLTVADGDVKILDFGLVRVDESAERLSRTGQIIGTPYFMSPEQARGESIDPRSDLFSLGSTLYVAMSGNPPFAGRSPTEVLMNLTDSEPMPMSQVVPEAPPELANLVHRLLAKSPAHRPAGAAAVAEALAKIEADIASAETFSGFQTGDLSERVRSRRSAGAPPTAKKAASAHRLFVAGVGAVIGGLAALGIVTLIALLILAFHPAANWGPAAAAAFLLTPVLGAIAGAAVALRLERKRENRAATG